MKKQRVRAVEGVVERCKLLMVASHVRPIHGDDAVLRVVVQQNHRDAGGVVWVGRDAGGVYTLGAQAVEERGAELVRADSPDHSHVRAEPRGSHSLVRALAAGSGLE